MSHLVGAALTRLDLASGAASRLDLPAGPLRTPSGKALRTPSGKALGAALGFAITIAGDRLFAARHALGVLETQFSFGAVERFAEDPLDNTVATGRHLFYNATDRITSDGLACSGCHPRAATTATCGTRRGSTGRTAPT